MSAPWSEEEIASSESHEQVQVWMCCRSRSAQVGSREPEVGGERGLVVKSGRLLCRVDVFVPSVSIEAVPSAEARIGREGTRKNGRDG